MSVVCIQTNAALFLCMFVLSILGSISLSQVNNTTQHNSQDNIPYVEVNWRRSEEDQIGHHACTARKLDDNSEEVTCSTQVKFRQNKLDGLSEKTQSLQDRLKQLEARFEHFLQQQKDELYSVDSLEQRLNVTVENLDIVRNTLSNIRTEEGFVNCYDSNGFSLFPSEGLPNRVRFIKVNFTKPFSKIPEVWGSIRAVSTNKNTNFRYLFTVRNIDTLGFTLGCHTWGDTIIDGIDYQWRATTPIN
uniref:H-type lectin domain-containing protein n=1 Tax=Biomphalaria glabrata TaxID=6526 RepID=A0A2C9M660_BIOGL